MSELLYLDGNLRIFAIICASILLLCFLEWRGEQRRKREAQRIADLNWETKRTDRKDERLASPDLSSQARFMQELRTQHLTAQFQYGLNFPESES